MAVQSAGRCSGPSRPRTVFPLLILAITDSPAAAGIAGALWSLPYMLFSLPAAQFRSWPTPFSTQPLIRFMAFLTGGVNFVYAANGLVLIVLAKRLGAGDAVIGILFVFLGVFVASWLTYQPTLSR